jgi:alpha,alpha-trehalase
VSGDTPGEHVLRLAAHDCELVIFDLDGVLTQTARVHAAAWKAAFDAFLARHCGADFRPFDPVDDYLAHVDGKPRQDGVRDFLASRGIVLEEGSPGDAAHEATEWALGNAKNAMFQAVLERDGVATYAPAVALFNALGACGIARAVVSASRNCHRILEAAGLAGQAEVVLDGNDAERLGLAGKPAPDTFLAAARRLQVPPQRAAVIEDAEAGVAAARAGRFGWVIGIDRAEHAAALRRAGADHVLRRLDDIRPQPLPGALPSLHEIDARLQGAPPALFLDYDGTLTPIVDRPEDAVLHPPMRAALAACARRYTVVVVTGRGLEVVRELVGMRDLVYAADHGFQVLRPGHAVMQPETIAGFEAVVAEVADRLTADLGTIRGVLIERKRYSVAVHYRLVAGDAVAGLRRTVEAVLTARPTLRLLEGKKVLELQPAVNWDKGAAVAWLMQELGIVPSRVVYVGDDVTDESAFRLLRGSGITIAVQDAPRPTAAVYRIDDVEQVRRLLLHLGGGDDADEALSGQPA